MAPVNIKWLVKQEINVYLMSSVNGALSKHFQFRYLAENCTPTTRVLGNLIRLRKRNLDQSEPYMHTGGGRVAPHVNPKNVLRNFVIKMQ